MDFQGHREMRPGLDEAFDPQAGVAGHPEDLDLRGVHERVKQGAEGEVLVENDDVGERQRIHVADFRGLKSGGTYLGKEFWRGEPCAAQLEDANLIQ